MSIPRFQGEDLMCPERRKVQRDQQRAWLQQQMTERKVAETDRKMAERQLQKAVEARDRRAQDMDAAERNCRQQLLMSAARYNHIMVYAQFMNLFVIGKYADSDQLYYVIGFRKGVQETGTQTRGPTRQSGGDLQSFNQRHVVRKSRDWRIHYWREKTESQLSWNVRGRVCRVCSCEIGADKTEGG